MAYSFIQAFHHVQLAILAGTEDETRAFYCGALGFEERERPRELVQNGGCWLQAGSLSLHLGVEVLHNPASKAHPAFEVSDLVALRKSLKDYAPTEISELLEVKKFYVHDPFGNRLEFVASKTA